MKKGDTVIMKNHPNPKFNLGDKLKVEYVQIAYDDRYIIVKQNIFGTKWSEIVKLTDKVMAEVILNALINDVKDPKKQKSLNNELVDFFNDVENYDKALDIDAEKDVIV